MKFAEQLSKSEIVSEYSDDEIDPDRPYSTRSKIVVHLIELRDENGNKRPFQDNDNYEYYLDPYDKMRFKLVKEGEAMFEAYE